MTTISDTHLMLYLSLVRELIDELNKESASGLISHRALPMISYLDQQTRTLAKRIHDAQSDRPPQQ